MAKLTSDLKQAFNNIKLFPLATSSDSGIPNVVPVKYVFVENDDEIWIIDNFMSKTINNMTDNPQAALYVYATEINVCCQIKGNISIQTSGEKYDRMRSNIHKILPNAPAKSLVVMNVTDIYQCAPGSNAGERIN
jgi:predicted pyridoxine 5'-phosphate oxidase superfamily flavin-nucleotide-binding protein